MKAARLISAALLLAGCVGVSSSPQSDDGGPAGGGTAGARGGALGSGGGGSGGSGGGGTPLSRDCEDGTAHCDANATCTDLAVGHRCTCKLGYTGDGTTCTQVGEVSPAQLAAKLGLPARLLIGTGGGAETKDLESQGLTVDIYERYLVNCYGVLWGALVASTWLAMTAWDRLTAVGRALLPSRG